MCEPEPECEPEGTLQKEWKAEWSNDCGGDLVNQQELRRLEGAFTRDQVVFYHGYCWVLLSVAVNLFKNTLSGELKKKAKVIRAT